MLPEALVPSLGWSLRRQRIDLGYSSDVAPCAGVGAQAQRFSQPTSPAPSWPLRSDDEQLILPLSPVTSKPTKPSRLRGLRGSTLGTPSGFPRVLCRGEWNARLMWGADRRKQTRWGIIGQCCRHLCHLAHGGPDRAARPLVFLTHQWNRDHPLRPLRLLPTCMSHPQRLVVFLRAVGRNALRVRCSGNRAWQL